MKKNWLWMNYNSAYNAGDLGSIPGSGRSSGEGNGNPLQYSCLENPMDGGTWLGYSPWGRKESDMTEQAPYSSTLAWKIPWMEEPGGLQSMAS